MSFFTVASIAVGVVGIGLQISGARKAEDAAIQQGQDEAVTERAVTKERIRQIGREEEIMRGDTIGRVAASGVKVDMGSPLEILADQASEFQREKSITQEVGASRAKLALSSASALGTQYKYQGYAAAAQGLGSIFSIASKRWGG